jgi:RHS repeat-associated protein
MAGTYTVTATSTVDNAVYGEATVTVRDGLGVDVRSTYDLNGNLTSDGTRTFEWDAENRLVAVTIVATGHRSEFGYDGLGRRVQIRELDPDTNQNFQVSSDTKYLWDDAEVIESRTADGGTVLQRFYAQGFVDIDGTALYYSKDHLGSIRELTDGTQTVRARYDYDPYGRVTKISGDRDSVFGFAGTFWHVQSSLNLTLYRGYDPNYARWISQDPMGEVMGINKYIYCGNSPTNFNDPLGLQAVIPFPGEPAGGLPIFIPPGAPMMPPGNWGAPPRPGWPTEPGVPWFPDAPHPSDPTQPICGSPFVPPPEPPKPGGGCDGILTFAKKYCRGSGVCWMVFWSLYITCKSNHL